VAVLSGDIYDKIGRRGDGMKTKPGSRLKSSNFIRIKSSNLMRRVLIYGVSFIFIFGLSLLAGGKFLLSASTPEANDGNSHDQTSEGKAEWVELSSSKELTEALRLAAQLQPHAQLKPQVRTETEHQDKTLLQAQAQAQAQAVPVQNQPPAWQIWRQSLLPAQAQSKTKSQTKTTKTAARTQDTWISGVWMHPGLFGPKQDEAVSKMRTVLDDYAKAGINTLIMLVKDTSGYVYYQSDIGLKDPAYDWDFFGVFLSEARKRNMVVHPWFCVFPEGALLGQVRQHPEWLIVGPAREMVRTVNPALPEVRAYEISLMIELVKKYGVDWVHLDYIRFPCEPTEPYFSHDPKTLQLFKDETGIDFNSLKARDSGNPHWNAWLGWNRQQVTRFVKELKDELLTTGRQVRISTAVFPDADNARVLIGQDWEKWAQQGLIDMLCPMIYTNDTALFDRLTKRAVAIGLGSSGEKTGGEAKLLRKIMVCPGIGIGTSHNQSTPDIMMEEIRLARIAGADGVIFFSGNSLTAPFLNRMGSGQRISFIINVLPDYAYYRNHH
jgi:uncharacterized lipoprotein YddW (UPF0748 family)